jgi:hypothetical protein
MQLDTLSNFHDSPAIRILDTIGSAVEREEVGSFAKDTLQLFLETLVELGTFSEGTDKRDTIYSLLNLAKDIAGVKHPGQSIAILPDYSKNVLDVYVDFILHCRQNSMSLDIIYRPWAPASTYTVPSISGGRATNSELLNFPSWIVFRNNIPFGDPSWKLKHRLHDKSLVGSSKRPVYPTNYGSQPQVTFGRDTKSACDGSMYAKDLILGEIDQRSTRMASAIVTSDSLEIGGRSLASRIRILYIFLTKFGALCVLIETVTETRHPPFIEKRCYTSCK